MDKAVVLQIHRTLRQDTKAARAIAQTSDQVEMRLRAIETALSLLLEELAHR